MRAEGIGEAVADAGTVAVANCAAGWVDHSCGNDVCLWIGIFGMGEAVVALPPDGVAGVICIDP